MAEDLLKAEHVPAVDKVTSGERVAERVWRAARADARPPAEPGDGLLGAALAQRTLPTGEEWVRRPGPRPGPEIPDERTPRCRSHRHDPFLRALAEDVERPIRTDVANTEGRQLGQSEPGVEEEQDEGPLALVAEGQQAPELKLATEKKIAV